jgi:NAD(P)-dependent dehydrogenase (short-subunit alcohol dehydrogenase family)
MKTVVITGSTRGIGFGLADAFLAKGCRIIVNGRSQESVDQACAQLSEKHAPDLLDGFAAVVSEHSQVEALWQYAVEKLESIDIWINNAGLGHETVPFWDIPADEARAVIEANILGVTYGSQTAMRGMLEQGKGQIYNMEGFGSGGHIRYGMSLYGTSKAAVSYITKAMIEETKESDILVGALSPGMVMTDLVLDRFKDDPAELEKRKRIFNIIADSVDNVAPWLAQRILSNDKHGARFAYMPPAKMIGRFMSAPFSKRDLFASIERDET